MNCANSGNVLIEDYVSRLRQNQAKYWLISPVLGLDSGAGHVELESHKQSHPSGMGAKIAKFKFFNRIGAAVFVEGKQLRLVVDGVAVDLLDPSCTATRTPILPFVQRFIIDAAGKRLLTFDYCAVDVWESPQFTLDFLKWIAEVAELPERRLNLFFTWEAIHAGKQVTDAATTAEIERRVSDSLKSYI